MISVSRFAISLIGIIKKDTKYWSCRCICRRGNNFFNLFNTYVIETDIPARNVSLLAMEVIM